MTIYYVSSTSIGTAPGFTFTADGDTLVVLPGATLASTTSFGSVIDFGGRANSSIVILGTVIDSGSIVNNFTPFTLTIGEGGTYFSNLRATTSGAIFTIVAGSQWNNAGEVRAPGAIAMVAADTGIANSGTISGDTAIFSWQLDGSRIVNAGLIEGTGTTGSSAYGTAITFNGVSGSVLNQEGGRITAQGAGKAAIRLAGDTDGTRIVNRGSIDSLGGNAVLVESAPDGSALVLSNTGIITGHDLALASAGNVLERVINRGTLAGGVDLAGGADRLDNRNGTILGDAVLGDGDDLYDGRGGAVSGQILGGLGADSFLGNANEGDSIDGGDGLDEIDYRHGGAITLALDGSFEASGGALGDVLISIERVIGSGLNDVMRGSAGADQLLGGGGADYLNAANGADIIRGGTGTDTLKGGLGNDSFRFASLLETGDIISDFTNIAGNNDQFQIVASGFGGGLVAGALAANQFQSRADNVAQDADDRFIFRTTDRTLWFDADGTGSGGASLVADLQAGAVVSASDILLI